MASPAPAGSRSTSQTPDGIRSKVSRSGGGDPSPVGGGGLERGYAAVHGPAPPATLTQVADHIDHVARIAGHDHVGIGSDFYGSRDEPQGLEDVSRFPELFAELIRRGWSDSDLRKLAGGNLLRVLRIAETTATRLAAQRPPSTATIDLLDAKTAR